MTPLDLLTPRGRLHAAALWPKRSKAGYDEAAVFDKLRVFITEGEGQAELAPEWDAAFVTATWAYYRAFDERYQVMVNMPAEAHTNQGGRTFTDSQIGEMKKQRDEMWDMLPPEVRGVVNAAVPQTRASVSSPVTLGW
jgi:hypothetical protein